MGQAVGGTVDPRQGRDLSETTIARRFNLKPGTTTPSPAPKPLEKPLLRPKGAKKPKVSRAVTFAQELGDRPRTGGFAATVSPSRLDAARQAAATQQVTGLGGQLAEVSADPTVDPARTRRMLEMRRNLPGPSPGFEQPATLQLSGGGKDPLGDDDDTDDDKPEKDDPQTPKDDPRSPFPRGPIKIPDPEPEETPAAPVDRMRSLTREPELSPSPEPAMAQRATREEATRLRSPEAVAPTPAPEETMPEETMPEETPAPAPEPTAAADPVGLLPADPKLATESPAEQEDVFDPDEDAILDLQQKVAEQRRQIERGQAAQSDLWGNLARQAAIAKKEGAEALGAQQKDHAAAIEKMKADYDARTAKQQSDFETRLLEEKRQRELSSQRHATVADELQGQIDAPAEPKQLQPRMKAQFERQPDAPKQPTLVAQERSEFQPQLAPKQPKLVAQTRTAFERTAPKPKPAPPLGRMEAKMLADPQAAATPLPTGKTGETRAPEEIEIETAAPPQKQRQITLVEDEAELQQRVAQGGRLAPEQAIGQEAAERREREHAEGAALAAAQKRLEQRTLDVTKQKRELAKKEAELLQKSKTIEEGERLLAKQTQVLQTQAEQAGQTQTAQFKKMKAKLLKSQQIAKQNRVKLEQDRAKLEQDKAGIQAGINRTLAEQSERMAQNMQQQLHNVHQSLHGQAANALRNARAHDQAKLHAHTTHLAQQVQNERNQMQAQGIVQKTQALVEAANRRLAEAQRDNDLQLQNADAQVRALQAKVTQLENRGKKPSPRLQNQIDSLQNFKTDLQQNLADFEKRVQESIGRQKPTTPADPPVDPRIAAADKQKKERGCELQLNRLRELCPQGEGLLFVQNNPRI